MSIDMNKTITEASLDNLHDIIVPEAIGFFPPAPGWYVVALLLLALLFHFSIGFYKRHKKSLYRREAIEELGSYEAQGEDKEKTLHLLTLAKRVAIAAYGREEIAKLSGESWWDFMEKHSKAIISKELRVSVNSLLYDKSYAYNTADYKEIEKFVQSWVKTHKVAEDV